MRPWADYDEKQQVREFHRYPLIAGPTLTHTIEPYESNVIGAVSGGWPHICRTSSHCWRQTMRYSPPRPSGHARATALAGAVVFAAASAGVEGAPIHIASATYG